MPDIMDADPVVVHPGKYLFVVVSTCLQEDPTVSHPRVYARYWTSGFAFYDDGMRLE